MKLQMLLLIAALFVCGVFAVGEEHLPKHKRDTTEWTYAEQEHWPGTCATGRFQSPIDIDTHSARRRDLGKLPWQPIRSSTAQVYKSHGTTTTALFVTPHTNTLDFEAPFLDKYNLIQLHYHTPSEHRVDGQQYPLELHFVHSNHHGALSVIGVFFREGRRNRALDQLINQNGFPEQETAPTSTFRLDSLLDQMNVEDYWTYSGSLTTPPCTEGVRWFVLKKVLTASEEQIEALHQAYGESARNAQVLNTRTVWARETRHHEEYEDEGHRPQGEHRPEGEGRPRPGNYEEEDEGEEKPRPRPGSYEDDKKRSAPKVLGKH